MLVLVKGVPSVRCLRQASKLSIAYLVDTVSRKSGKDSKSPSLLFRIVVRQPRTYLSRDDHGVFLHSFPVCKVERLSVQDAGELGTRGTLIPSSLALISILDVDELYLK